ncbi:unnamed protein product [Adineta ricciae]|uniref:Reverse transcriptase domain-containing protein n=1 Tax=Adineta ricciae TaxID=249248 RepID=A0A814YRD9_ADIRI|nr:unnamed protein product [Adineta ricciae]CAF1478622.1 unnamed protein product [Adineta ricciae]
MPHGAQVPQQRDQANIPPSTMQYNNTTAATDKEKADIFADYFEKAVYSKAPDTLPFHKQVARQAKKVKKDMLHPSTITKWEKLSTKEITEKPYRAICTTPHSIVQYDYGSWIHTRHLEESMYYLTLEAEQGQASSIQLSPHQSHELSRNILRAHQARFCAKKRTLYNIVRLERFARSKLHRPGIRQHSTVIFFDIKVAFDSVWHDGLIYKLPDLLPPQQGCCNRNGQHPTP